MRISIQRSALIVLISGYPDIRTSALILISGNQDIWIGRRQRAARARVDDVSRGTRVVLKGNLHRTRVALASRHTRVAD